MLFWIAVSIYFFIAAWKSGRSARLIRTVSTNLTGGGYKRAIGTLDEKSEKRLEKFIEHAGRTLKFEDFLYDRLSGIEEGSAWSSFIAAVAAIMSIPELYKLLCEIVSSMIH